MLDNQDIEKVAGVLTEKLTGVFATKQDLDRFATKEDLKQFATKKDLENFATKQDLKKMEDKIADTLTERFSNVFATKQDFREIKTDLADIKEIVQGLVVSNDGVIKTITKLDLEYAAMSQQLSRHDKQIRDLEVRLPSKA